MTVIEDGDFLINTRKNRESSSLRKPPLVPQKKKESEVCFNKFTLIAESLASLGSSRAQRARKINLCSAVFTSNLRSVQTESKIIQNIKIHKSRRVPKILNTY